MAGKPLTISFNKEKETKRTHMFVEAGDAEKHIIGRLYVQKTELEKLGFPEKLKVVITAG